MKRIILIFIFSFLLFGCNNEIEKEILKNDNSILGYWEEINYYKIEDGTYLEDRNFMENHYIKIDNDTITFITIDNDEKTEIKYLYKIVDNNILIEIDTNENDIKDEYELTYIDSIINNKLILDYHPNITNRVKSTYVQIAEEELNNIINNGGDNNE